MRFNLLQYVVPEVKELYNWLEVDFHPLKLSGRVTKVKHLTAATHLIKRKMLNSSVLTASVAVIIFIYSIQQNKCY